MKVINILEPFYSAGKKYGWQGKPIGLGIDLRLLEGDDSLYVKVGNKEKVWEINKKTAKEFVEKYKSFFNAKGTMLGVIAWFMFKEHKEKEKQQPLL